METTAKIMLKDPHESTMMQQISVPHYFGPNSSDVDTRDKGRHRTGENTFNWEVSEIMTPSQMRVKEITSGTGLQ